MQTPNWTTYDTSSALAMDVEKNDVIDWFQRKTALLTPATKNARQIFSARNNKPANRIKNLVPTMSWSYQPNEMYINRTEVYPESTESELILDMFEKYKHDLEELLKSPTHFFLKIDQRFQIDSDVSIDFISPEKDQLFSELREIEKECSEVNWDGEGAMLVDRMTIEQAENFISALPEDIPLPEVAPDPDGEIAFDWIWDKGHTLSLSISPTGSLAYAWIDGEEKGHATSSFYGKMPQRLINELKGFLS